MIEEIRISNLGVIEESVLELGPGLNVITGETGAGKTMLVTALGLLLGGRADSGVVRGGAAKARVEGIVAADDDMGARIEELGGEVEEGTAVLGRQVSAEGRSRAFAGGATVPAGALSGLAERLVAVHGQSDQHRLVRADAQMAALDAFGGERVAAAKATYRDRFDELRDIERHLRDLTTSARERAQEADGLRAGLAAVEALSPTAGEDVALAREEARLGSADTLREAAERAREALSADDGPDAVGAVAAARQALDSIAEDDPEASTLAGRIAELSYLLGDLSADVASYATGLEVDPIRLAAVSDRRAALTDLCRKYGDTVDDVLRWADEAALRLLDLDGSDGQIAELDRRRRAVREELGRLAAELSDARSSSAEALGAAITAEIRQLSMPHARVEVGVTGTTDPDGLEVAGERLRFTAQGVDEVEFLLEANPGAPTRPLHKGASGGELSRVMLALEVALAATRPVPTFVFDEVDAGVGGKAAVEIGRRLAILARGSQVLVVTHLPQVAAFADHHVVVQKRSDGAVTTSGLTSLDDSGRVQELSRMLAGLEASDTALAHAAELLEVARESRESLR